MCHLKSVQVSDASHATPGARENGKNERCSSLKRMTTRRRVRCTRQRPESRAALEPRGPPRASPYTDSDTLHSTAHTAGDRSQHSTYSATLYRYSSTWAPCRPSAGSPTPTRPSRAHAPTWKRPLVPSPRRSHAALGRSSRRASLYSGSTVRARRSTRRGKCNGRCSSRARSASHRRAGRA